MVEGHFPRGRTMFQGDIAPLPKTKIVMEQHVESSSEFEHAILPPQFPHINDTEHLRCSIEEKYVQSRYPPTSLLELVTHLAKEWTNIFGKKLKLCTSSCDGVFTL